MGARFRSRWQKLKQHWLAFGVGAIVCVVVIVIIIIGYQFDWTGFKGKTVWDWLQLLGVLAIPVVVGFGAAWFTRVQQQRDQRLAREQHDHDQVLAEQRTNSEREAAEKRAQTEREITSDNQREAALQAYLDKMSELLLHENLRESKPEDVIRSVAQARTLTVFYGLDPVRKASVLRFLSTAGLTEQGKSICIELAKSNLRGTNLFSVQLPLVNLYQSDLREVDLYFANLYHAELRKADLRKASLYKAILVGTKLQGADLREVDLRESDLRGAELSRVNLTGAILEGANLKGVTGITVEELEKQAKSLKGATMPDGSIHL